MILYFFLWKNQSSISLIKSFKKIKKRKLSHAQRHQKKETPTLKKPTLKKFFPKAIFLF